ncbi:MAG: hypothetical protein V4850_08775 [Myxococcota bacterium]
MATATRTDTLQTYVSDVQSLVKHGLQVIDQQISNLKNEGHPEALQAVREFSQVLHSHDAALDARLKTLGGTATARVKEAVTRVAGMAAGVINAVRPEEASKSIRDDYTFFSHCAIAYLMLHTTASSLGDDATAQVADRGYRDCARMCMVIDRIMPALVLEELRQDGLPVNDVAARTRSMVADAWRREAVPAGVKV